MFIEINEVCNFSDDNDFDQYLSNILVNLNYDIKIILKWFRTISSLQTYPGKFQLMVLETKTENSVTLKINSIYIKESNQFSLNELVDNLYRREKQKPYVLQRIKNIYLWKKQNRYAALLWIVNLVVLHYFGCFAEKKIP